MHAMRVTALGACVAALIFTAGASAAPGSLDPTYGNNGLVTTDFNGNTGGCFTFAFDSALAAAAQPDGKLVAVGSAVKCPSFDFAVARYDSDGSLDASFGSGGLVTADFAGSGDSAQAVVVQPDGRIIVGGTASGGGFSGNDFAVARFLPDGTLDPTFGTNGKQSTPVSSQYDEIRALVLLDDGSVVAAGSAVSPSGYSDFALAKYDANGVLDQTFGDSGIVKTDFGGVQDAANALVVQDDGKFVAAGSVLSGTPFLTYGFGLARYHEDGSLDATFGSSGKVKTEVGSGWANALALQPDGKLVAAGRAVLGSTWTDFGLIRYLSDGTLDDSFGTDGIVTTNLGSDDEMVRALAITADGMLVAAGETARSGNMDFTLVRYLADGTTDESFGDDGEVVTDFGTSQDVPTALVLQGDGKALAVGQTAFDFALARYEVDGDTTPPELVVPSTVVTVDATRPDGWPADYTNLVSATDDSGVDPTPECTPASGSILPIGQQSTVVCTATDAAGNVAQGSFVVYVRTAAEQIEELLATIDGYRLNRLGSSLQDKLTTAKRQLAAGRNRQAEEAMASFIAQVEAQRDKGLSSAQADALTDAALRIIDVIG